MIRTWRSSFVACVAPVGLVAALTCATTPRVAVASGRGDADELARQILEATGVTGGLVIHLGCSDGQLTGALRAGDSFLVHGLDTDLRNVTQARQQLQAYGIYGPVSVDHFAGERLPYSNNVSNLLVVEQPGEVTIAEMLRVLVPRGVAYVRDGEQWNRHEKPWPAEMDEWTHWLHDASGNAVARDRIVGPPRRLQWVAGPRWSRHHNTTPSLNAAVSAAGRIFTISDDAPPGFDNSLPDRYYLYARDAFNGVLLWRIAIKDWGWAAWVQTMYSNFMLGRHMHPIHIQRRLVAVGHRRRCG